MSKSITNQKPTPTPVVEMDAGKFLHMINVGAQSQHALFSEKIAKMGETVGTSWKLISLHESHLMFEDTDTNTYYQADINRLGKGRVSIDNIKKVKVVESKKADSFKKNVAELIEAIAEEDSSRANSAFDRITAQRFRSSVIPENGLVTTRDGVTRYVNVARTIVNEDVRASIIAAIHEAVSEKVKINRGRIVEARFGSIGIRFPISEHTRRQVVARSMKGYAQRAYMAEGFQNRVKHCAALVAEDKVEDACQIVSELLAEAQEFCLLTAPEMIELVSNALATQGCMNENLAKDVGTLFYRVNCRVNREAILNDWREAARKSEFAPMVENVRNLSESTDFEGDYQAFLRAMFTEDMTTKAAKAKMYLAALKDMKNVLAGSQADADLIGSLDGYIVRLETAGDEVDDATLMEVEELVASTSETLLDDVVGLNDFDTIPQPDTKPISAFGGDDLGAEAGAPGAGPMGGAGAGPEIGAGGPGLPLGAEDEEVPGAGQMAPGAPGAPGAGQMGAMGAPKIPGAMPPKKPGVPGLDDLNLPLESKKGREDEVRIEDLDAKGLTSELVEWKKSGAEYFKKDGINECRDHLIACAKHAKSLNESELADAFKQVMAENTPASGEVSDDSYAYQVPEGTTINKKYGMSEDHEKMAEKMKESELGLPDEGTSAPPKGDAMGEQGEDDQNIMKDAGHKANEEEKGTVKKESIAPGQVACSECNGRFEMTKVVTETGTDCPDCGADLSKQIIEALDVQEDIKGAGHKMDRIEGGKGVSDNGLKKDEGTGSGGKKEGMDGQEGKGIAGESPKADDGTGSGGKKEGMDGQEGSSIADKGGEVEENQRQSASRGMRPRGFKKASINPSEGKNKKSGVAAEETTISVSGSDELEGRTDSRSTTFTTGLQVDDAIAQIADMVAQAPEAAGGEFGDEGGEGDSISDIADGMDGEGGEEGGFGGGEEAGGGEAGAGEPPVAPPEGGEGGEEGGEFGGEEEGGEMTPAPSAGPEEEEEERPFGESEMPDFIRKKIDAKKGKKDGGDKSDKGGKDEESESDDEESSDDDEGGNPFKEDNDITAPSNKKYGSEEAARKDGDGKQMNPKPKFSEKDYDGTKGAKTARGEKKD